MFRSREGARTLLFQGAITFGATTLVNVLNYLFHVLGSRMLGPAGYGEIAALFNLLTLASIPAAIVQLIVAKLVAELRAGDGPQSDARVRAVYDRLVGFMSWAALGVLIAGCLLTPALAAFLRVAGPLPVVLTVVVIAANFVLTSIRGILQGAQRFAPFAASLGIESIGKCILGLWLVGMHFGVGGALAGYALGSLTSLVFTVLAIRRAFAARETALFIDMRRLWQSSQGIAATQACLTVLGFSDIVVVKHFFAPVEAGIYSAVALTGKVLLFLVGFVPLLVLPRAAAAVDESSRQILLVAGGFLAIAAGAVLLVFAAAPAVVVRTMAGDAFVAAAPFILPYGFAMTLLAATQILVTYNIGQHRFRFVFPFAAVTLADIAALIAVPHQIASIVLVLVIGNLCALVASLTALGATKRAARPA